ncbi:hypothetical protein BJV85_003960 [Clostridium acetobutylicum]|uniref:Predicted membrane protein n=1 Tax=Clostridium acetobutylicum (strain ATCC 824 / DSM 792 / JCM 1419 / IAM 19013 / LMG 5710 / NBRC 13948 / NRRL B-527 / VKM B-1787 / 2291 / W) TaxID=272562 RepID=Q97MM3_CLOAB|nr:MULTISPECIES: hypothetical protein [Clostridium]AAK78155.1 Predicted membrane protein [Clostridium acetobutylicum ATCC 824]ADZ19217.1 membrane protein [Clostridium acetobutylicum EA 2018]AEI31093.1 hypothetical protein SMB_G0175 [Clostridium acetobutylicum DSM 1731]AWV81961.1 hypothetical protein DK921_18160 [Clostridium acetobutylicum]KHD34858.1 membrane protein [Clostridium acetobutylicum]
MSITLLTGIGEIFLGILLNVFIGKIVKIVFKKDGTLPRVPVRFIGITLILNGVGNMVHL